MHIFEIDKKVICNFESFSQNENNLFKLAWHLGPISLNLQKFWIFGLPPGIHAPRPMITMIKHHNSYSSIKIHNLRNDNFNFLIKKSSRWFNQLITHREVRHCSIVDWRLKFKWYWFRKHSKLLQSGLLIKVNLHSCTKLDKSFQFMELAWPMPHGSHWIELTPIFRQEPTGTYCMSCRQQISGP